jgi:hypothetical protein
VASPRVGSRRPIKHRHRDDRRPNNLHRFRMVAAARLVIPIFDWRASNNSYWGANEERVVWGLIKRLCEGPTSKVFQNGMYDIHFLWRKYGIAPARLRARHDATPPLNAPGDAQGPWFSGFIVHFGTGLEDHAAEGERNLKDVRGRNT